MLTMNFSEEKIVIQTERLVLRQWRTEDLEPFAKLNADPRVMEYFPALKTREESEASVKFMFNHIHKYEPFCVALDISS